MKDIIVDTLLDTLKLVPFLFLAFLIIELIEHKLNNKQIITKSKKYSKIIGSLFGIIPQCGLSVIATNLYVTRIITLGTLISIYLSTSDEMLPIFISEKVNPSIIFQILLIKVLFGFLFGTIIDFIVKKKDVKENYHICGEEHCNCEKNIFISAIKHTTNIIIYILIVTFILNTLITYLDDNMLSNIFLKNTIFSPFISSLIGLIPNCGSSVILTKLYLSNIITLPSLISGLLTGSGSAFIVLFKENHNLKENLGILLTMYFLGTIGGIILTIIENLI